MKTLKLLFFVVVILLSITFSSCSSYVRDENRENESQDDKIPISLLYKIPSVDFSTRLNESAFESNDTIGVYVLNETGKMANERWVDNYPFVFDGLNFYSEDVLYYKDRNSKCSFVAYYPFSKEGIVADASKLPIEVQSDQSTKMAYANSDFVLAYTTPFLPTHNPTVLSFNHKLCKLNFMIKPALASDVDQLNQDASLYINNVFINSTYDIDNYTIGDYSNLSNVYPFGEWTTDVTGEKVVGKKLILIPQDISNAQIVLQIEGRTYVSSFPTNMALDSGMSYNIVLKYDSRVGLSGISYQMNDWTEYSDDYEAEIIEQPYLKQVALQNLNYSESSVYNIETEDGTVLGLLCKEYLFNNDIDASAIVYYPSNTPMLGTVLHVIGDNRKIHGGVVAWSDDNSFVYTPGDSNPILNICFDDNGDMIRNEIENSPFVGAKPYQLVDQRGSEINYYPIVKIGMQYWMRENLKSLLYTDNAQITNHETDYSVTSAGYYINDGNVYYNAAAVLSGKIAPSGWSVSSEKDWEDLKKYIGDKSAKLKMGNRWLSYQDIDAPNNITGFGGVPIGGYFSKESPSIFMGLNDYVFYWSLNGNELAENGSALNARTNNIRTITYHESCAYVVRCVKN